LTATSHAHTAATTVANDQSSALPPWYALAYIMKMPGR
jgi:hypothetical protein